MLKVFEKLLRSNFRFGRMFYSRTDDMAGRIAAPAVCLFVMERETPYLVRELAKAGRLFISQRPKSISKL